MARAFQRPDKNKLDFRPNFYKDTGQRHQVFTAMEKFFYSVSGLKPSLREKMLEELLLMLPKVRANLIEIRYISAAI